MKITQNFLSSTLSKYVFALLNITTLCIAIIYFTLFQTSSLKTPLTWDEVNYASAAELGIVSNAFEKGSLNLIQFFNLGYSKLTKKPLNTSNYPPEYNDPFNLRHFHPPLPVYFWSFFSKQNKLLRLSNLFLGFIFILLLIIMIYLVQSNRDILLTIETFPLISVFMISKIFNYSFSSLNFHTFFLISSILFIGLLIRFLNKPTQINVIFMGIAGAFLVVTLETWIVIISASALAVLILRYKNIFSFKLVSTFFISFLASLLILWPGIIKTGGPIKAWLMYTYRIFDVRKEYSHVLLMKNWFEIINKNYWLFILFLFALISTLYLFKRLAMDKTLLIPFIIGACYALFITPFILNNTYILPAIGIIIFGTIIILQRFFSVHRRFYILLTLLMIIVVITTTITTNFYKLQNKSTMEVSNFNIALTEIKNIITLEKGKPLLVDGGFIFRYYLKTNRNTIEDLDGFDPLHPQFYRRIDYTYENQLPLIQKKYYGAIIFQTNRHYSKSQMEQLKQLGYHEKHIIGYYIFYL
jgi:hypothetical protein